MLDDYTEEKEKKLDNICIRIKFISIPISPHTALICRCHIFKASKKN